MVVNQELNKDAQRAIQGLAERYEVSTGAVVCLLQAVAAGGGRMAQFRHPELGGTGQWMEGGMTMVGDMFNSQLKAKVTGLCQELSNLRATGVVPAAAGQADSGEFALFSPARPFDNGDSGAGSHWWPQGLGEPSSTGSDNDRHYAYFPQSHRLVLKLGQELAIYDTLGHSIHGLQQQSGDSRSLQFTSQRGTFSIGSLPLVSSMPNAVESSTADAKSPAEEPATRTEVPGPRLPDAKADAGERMSTEQILNALEQLGQLHQQRVLTDAEFSAKKADLLARL